MNSETISSTLPMVQSKHQTGTCSKPPVSVSTPELNRNETRRARITPSVNKVSATLSSSNIIESKCPHNTRGRSVTHKRVNPRDERRRKHIDYSIYYSSGDSGNETSPSPKKSRSVAEISLQEPTPAWLKSQSLITRQRLQELSPNSGRVRLIYTVIPPRPLVIKPKIKKKPIVKTEKSAEIADYLSKGLCLSAHVDGSACVNIQNPNNINVKPMGIREHRKKQRTEKALFEAHMRAMKEQRNNQDRPAPTSTTQSTNKETVVTTCAEVHNSETEKACNKPSISRTQTEDMDLDLFSDAIFNDALDVFQHVEHPIVNEQALQLFSYADDDDNYLNVEKPTGNNSALDADNTSHRNAVTTACDSSAILSASIPGNTVTSSPVHQYRQEPGLFSSIKESNSDLVKITITANGNAVTSQSDIVIDRNIKGGTEINMPMTSWNAIATDSRTPGKNNLETESDNDTIVYNDLSDTGTPLLAEDSEYEVNLNSTTDYTNQDANPSDTELEELTLNRCSSQTYSHVKKTLISCISKDLPTPVKIHIEYEH